LIAIDRALLVSPKIKKKIDRAFELLEAGLKPEDSV